MNSPTPIITLAQTSTATPYTSTSATTLSIAVLAFGVVVLGLQAWIMVRRGKGWGNISSRLAVITLVIVAALFIATSGVAHENTATVLGLLGTIAGYVLGKTDSRSPTSGDAP